MSLSLGGCCQPARDINLLDGHHAASHMFNAYFAVVGVRRSTQLLSTTCIRRKFTIPASTMGAVGRHTVNTTERLAALRELMARKENAVEAFVVPSEDQREYSDR